MPKYIPIGIAGKKYSGKDTAARLIMDYWPREPWKKAAFADPIRAISTVFGFTEDQMNNPLEKERPDSFWNISWRKFATMVGTDLFRKRWRWDVWVRLAEKRILDYPERRYVFTDIRYDNEAELIKKYGGFIIQIDRRQPVERRSLWRRFKDRLFRHSSEDGISRKLVDFVVVNDTTLEHFEDSLYDMLDEELYPAIVARENREPYHART